jgi:hypothetical protein
VCTGRQLFCLLLPLSILPEFPPFRPSHLRIMFFFVLIALTRALISRALSNLFHCQIYVII